jgi:hypothetical protein
MNRKLCLGLGALLGLVACAEIRHREPDPVTLQESRPVADTRAFDVDIEYGAGRLEITKAEPSDLFSIDLDYDRGRFEPTVDFAEGEQASLRLLIDEKDPDLLSGGRSSDLQLRLNDTVPLDLDIKTGVADGHLDLTDLDIRSLRLVGGVGRTEASFDRPVREPVNAITVVSGIGELVLRGLGNTRARRLDIEGGVGRTELDYTGEIGESAMESTIKVGVGAVRLILPRDADIEIEGNGNFLSNISAPSSFSRSGSTYTHRGPDGVNPRLRIRVESGIGGVVVELV